MQEANVYVKKALGHFYNEDSKNIITSLYEAGKLSAVDHCGNGEWKFV